MGISPFCPLIFLLHHAMTELLQITSTLAIPRDELQFRFTRSGGPGGQNVNKTATQVELLFDAQGSPALNDEQRARLMQTLKRRIDSDGVLHLVSHATRSQSENREDAVARFVALLTDALKPIKKRKPVKPSRALKEKRLAAKKARGEIKQQRKVVLLD
jgi:ribosome-associated protein